MTTRFIHSQYKTCGTSQSCQTSCRSSDLASCNVLFSNVCKTLKCTNNLNEVLVKVIRSECLGLGLSNSQTACFRCVIYYLYKQVFFMSCAIICTPSA